ncbi:tetratricopeptide repeat protein [Cupriavidus pauculus]|uniref:tetratricopeptide repeat protein n=1 Tax=Cupriavidus pauculus TaxID=82633 RepID=UPI00147865AB|nr:SEL1-like repeat protein [Cupriavidus pauculus]MCM3608222.1 SEL1-like repeat protein [Cupriavidus pauculus]UAL00374.1 SEL1-like repeat protein [Cupriavidus pauculus]
MNIGAAFAASRAQERIYKGCMYAKGWSDSAKPKDEPAGMASSSLQPNAIPPKTESMVTIYPTPEAQWRADAEEFFTVYPAYRTEPLYDRLNSEVKQIATKKSDSITGPQILLSAHESLVRKALGASEPKEGSDERLVSTLYKDAVSNNVVGQNALGMGFLNGWKPLPKEPKRALYWFQQSAFAGDPTGQAGYGVMLFRGNGIAPDRKQGYAWVAKAAASGDEVAKAILLKLDGELSAGR